MKAIYKVPNHTPIRCKIPNTLNALQSMVQGHIEVLELKRGVDLIVNEMGVLENSPLNMVLWFQEDKLEIPIYGTMLFVSAEGEDFCSLTEAQAKYAFDVAESGVV